MSKRKSKNNTISLILNFIIIVLAVLVVVGIFIPGYTVSKETSLTSDYSLMNLFNFSQAGDWGLSSYGIPSTTITTLTALFALFTTICVVLLAVVAVLNICNVKMKYGYITNVILGILTALFAILTFLMIPCNVGFDYIGDSFLAGMWMTFICGILTLPVAIFNRK